MSDKTPEAVASNDQLGPKTDDVSVRWNVRFALPDGYYTFTTIGASNNVPISLKYAWQWAEREVEESGGKYLGVASVYAVDN